MAPDAELLGSKRHTAPPRLHTARIHEAKQFGFNSVHPAPDCIVIFIHYAYEEAQELLDICYFFMDLSLYI